MEGTENFRRGNGTRKVLMMIELKETEFDGVTTVFEPLKYHIGVRAIIGGYIPGRIWVDDSDNCKTALIWDTRYAYYLSGYIDNPEFNAALDQLFTEIIAPEALKKNIRQFFMMCPPTWEKRILNNEILINRFPKEMKRCYYTFKQKVFPDWKNTIPSGFTMERVDENLLKRTNLENIDTLTSEIRDIIASVDEFVKRGFVGYCLIYKDKEVASWCLSFMYGSSCEFTVQTVKKYQQRGFGTLVTDALIDYCLSSNFTSIGWHCNQGNIPSMKLAEKVGFERTDHDYSWIYGDLTH